MPGTTAGGLPYPLPSDPTRNGAADIKALADALQLRGHGLRIESGVRGNLLFTGGLATITFATAFANPPVVIWEPGNPFTVNNTVFTTGIQSRTVSGFVAAAWVINPTPGWYGAGMDVYYIAVG
jgi:hypothetical protein